MSNSDGQLAIRDQGQGQMIPWREMQEMAIAVSKSGLFACRSPEAAMTLMMLAQSEGLHPIQAMRQFHIIENRPTMRADAMQARFQQAGGTIKWITRTDTECEAEFSHPAGGTLSVRWDESRAKKAGLWGRNTWNKHPAQMLAARVIGEGVRAVLPSVTVGLYTPEEAVDFDDRPTPPPSTPTPASKPRRVASTVVEPANPAAGQTPDTPTVAQVQKAANEFKKKYNVAPEAIVAMIEARTGVKRLSEVPTGKRAKLLQFFEHGSPDDQGPAPADESQVQNAAA